MIREIKKYIRYFICTVRKVFSYLFISRNNNEDVSREYRMRIFLPEAENLPRNASVWIGDKSELNRIVQTTKKNFHEKYVGKSHALSLIPFSDVTTLSKDEFESTGVDPAFMIRSNQLYLPGGLVKINFHWESEKVCLPTLYYDCGYGFSDKFKFELCGVREGVSSTIVNLPSLIYALRFDPMEESGRFKITDVFIEELGDITNEKKFSLCQNTKILSHGYNAYLKSFFSDEEKDVSYQDWIKNKENIEDSLTESQSSGLKFSILMPTYESNVTYLEKAIVSILSQSYENIELCIVDDCSSTREVESCILNFQKLDSRIKFKRRESRGHISKASNDALELATGDYCVLVDHDDILYPHAIRVIAQNIYQEPQLALLYSDEDKLYSGDFDSTAACRYDPYFKSEWDSELILTQNFVSHVSTYKTELLRKIGGFREGYEGAQDWDLILRYSEIIKPKQICHIPHVLYHWRAVPGSVALGIDQKDYAYSAGLKTIEDSINRRNLNAIVEVNPLDKASYRIKYKHDDTAKAEIIIPTRNNYQDLKKCIDSIINKTTYKHYSISIVDNLSTDEATVNYLSSIQSLAGINISHFHENFNYSKINNQTIEKSNSDIIVLLNDDTEIIDGSWLEELVSQALRNEVGVVGSRLLYSDNTIQHGGVVLGVGGIANHAFQKMHAQSHGYKNLTKLVRETSAVTGACMAFKKDTWKRVKGFDQINLPRSFNDVDFCLKVRESGLKIIWTPFATLYHHESKTRLKFEQWDDEDKTLFEKESNYMIDTWGSSLAEDRFYSSVFNKKTCTHWL